MIAVAFYMGFWWHFQFLQSFHLFSSNVFKVKRRVPWRMSLNASAAPPWTKHDNVVVVEGWWRHWSLCWWTWWSEGALDALNPDWKSDEKWDYQIPMVVPPLNVTETNLDFPKEDIIEQKIIDCFSSQSQLRCFFVSKARHLFDAEHPSKLWLGQSGEEFVEEASTAPRCVDCVNLQQRLGREQGNIFSTCSKTLP